MPVPGIAQALTKYIIKYIVNLYLIQRIIT